VVETVQTRVFLPEHGPRPHGIIEYFLPPRKFAPVPAGTTGNRGRGANGARVLLAMIVGSSDPSTPAETATIRRAPVSRRSMITRVAVALTAIAAAAVIYGWRLDTAPM